MKIVFGATALSGATVLSAAIGLAMAMQGTPTRAAGMEDMTPQQLNQMAMDQMQKFIKNKMQKEHLEMCFGINEAGKNDCGTAAHSCMGQAKQARDPKSFVLVPAGACAKIPGGSLTPV